MLSTQGMVIAACAIVSTGIGVGAFVLGNTRADARKRRRIYERIDEVKDHQDKTFVRKDVCGMQHKYNNEKLDNIEKKVDQLIQMNGDTKNG